MEMVLEVEEWPLYRSKSYYPSPTGQVKSRVVFLGLLAVNPEGLGARQKTRQDASKFNGLGKSPTAPAWVVLSIPLVQVHITS